jgi:hypothetical protein
MGDWPVMNAARPAVQLCWPYQYAIDVRRLVAHHPHVVGGDVELADVVPPDDEDVRFVLRRRGSGKGHNHYGENGDSQSIRSHVTLLSVRIPIPNS